MALLSPEQQELIERYLPLVSTRVQRFVGYGMCYEDAIGWGNLGLCKAARYYDPKRNFASLAIRAIDASIIDGLRIALGKDNAKIAHIPLDAFHDAPIPDKKLSELERQTVTNSVDDLPISERVVIKLRYWRGKSLRQISEAMGISVHQASELHKNALAMLQNSPDLRELQPNGYQND